MTTPRDIALLAFDGVQLLDVSGPASVFGAANTAAGRPCYRPHVVSRGGGQVRSNSGVGLATCALAELAPAGLDSIFVAGGDKGGLRALAQDEAVRAWLDEGSRGARRFGSVCTGVFLLAELGLVDGRRVATHWESCAELARCYPRLRVDPNALYVEDGRVWTSAGVTSGIDMALAIVERDLGAAVAGAVAKELVLYARRPGHQTQFSALLRAQSRADAPFAELIDWMREHLSGRLDVATLAARVAMSERSFHRRFTELIGDTPAHFVETLRLDKARSLLGAGMAVKEVAAHTGYATPAQLSKAFDRRFGMAPSLYRGMHAQAAA